MIKSLLLLVSFISLLFITQNLSGQVLIRDQKIQEIRDKKQETLSLSLTAETTLDSLVDYQYASEMDSTRSEKWVLTWDDMGNWESDTLWKWDENETKWIYFEKYIYHFGNDSYMDSMNVFTWDVTQKNWINYQRYEDEYDQMGNRTNNAGFNWNVELNRWDKYSKRETMWNDEGLITNSKSFDGNEYNEWIPRYSINYYYDGNNNFISGLTLIWDIELNDWVNHDKQEYFYNQQSLLDSSYSYYWESVKVNPGFTKNKTDLTEGIQHTKVSCSPDEGYWDLWTKKEYQYNENNMVSERLHFWFEESSWNLSYKSEYEYDDHHNNVLYISSDWDDINNKWNYNYKTIQEYTYEYNEDGYTKMYASYKWDADLEIWLGTYKRESFWDDEGKSKLGIRYDWDENVNNWKFREKTFYYWSITTGLNTGIENTISVYPNPANSFLTIQSGKENNTDCLILSLTGQLIKQVKLDGLETRINMESFPAGIYFLQIKSETGIISKKIIKR